MERLHDCVQCMERVLLEMDNDHLIIAGRVFRSRLMVGTGKFPSAEALQAALQSSQAEIVTVALRRVNLNQPQSDSIMSVLDPSRYLILPNTSGARTAAEAVRLAKMARAMGLPPWVKLELTPEPKYLLPDPLETLKAAEILIREGFVVLPYIQADPVLAKRLEELGTATVMPLGAPIGSNRGLRTRDMIRIIIEQSKVPVVVDAGLGAPSHAAEAMELGADAVLVNTAMADAADHGKMAAAFALAVEAGRLAYLAGLGPVRDTASASSPLTGFLE
jgi:thiazole synthase